MIALVSTFLGFISSAIPECIRMFRDAQDRTHEVTLLKLQIAYDRARIAASSADALAAQRHQLQAIEVEAARAEQQALNARLQANLTGIHWVDALAGSVRPILTYAFFLLYFLVKLAQLYLLTNPALPWQAALTASQALVALWTEEDIAIFSAVVAFWFGQRAMIRAKR